MKYKDDIMLIFKLTVLLSTTTVTDVTLAISGLFSRFNSEPWLGYSAREVLFYSYYWNKSDDCLELISKFKVMDFPMIQINGEPAQPIYGTADFNQFNFGMMQPPIYERSIIYDD